MKKKLFGMLMLACIGLTSVHTTQAAVIHDSLQSNILNTVKHYMVYVPQGFNRNTEAHYPVLYLLHGLTDNHRAWTDKGQMDRVLDELIANGEIPPMVVVMPNAGDRDTRNVWNGYFNMPGWQYEDFFFQELVPAAEAKYRAGGSKEQRAVAGLSMGGGGSVGYATGHPDMFCACYAMSAWLTADARADATDKMGLLNNAVHAHDPIALLSKADDAQRTALRSVRWYIDCGDDDFLLEQNMQLVLALRRNRIPHQLRVRDGGHTWEYWHNALRLCLPFVARSYGR